MRAEQQAREARELVVRVKQQAREAREHAARVEHQACEARETFAQVEQVVRERHATTPSRSATDQQQPGNWMASGTKLFCIECKAEGHIARRCPNKRAETTTSGIGIGNDIGVAAHRSSLYVNRGLKSSGDDSIKVKLPPSKFSKRDTKTPPTTFIVSPFPSLEDPWTTQDPIVFDSVIKIELSLRPKPVAIKGQRRKKLICYACKQGGHLKRNCVILAERGEFVED
jgi:hypothetical protein